MDQAPDVKPVTEIRDGMKITWHQSIVMDDGLRLDADVFAPTIDGTYPVIMTYGVYAKGLAYQDGYPHQWKKMVADHPRSSRARPTPTRTGRSPIPSAGSRTATS